MLERIASIIREQCGLDSSSSIVCGVSGGPDSLCLLHVFHRLGYGVVAAHLDHQLREESAEDAAFVEATALTLGVPFVLKTADVAGRARRDGLSVEDAGRKSRYEFLFEQSRVHSAGAVAVGHTADDQAETVLMHLIRGSGLAGLRGMSYRSLLPTFGQQTPIVRPLLSTWRSETEAYCLQNGLQPVIDRSNASFDFLRNRVRHELMPLLEAYNPRVREALWRTAESVAQDLSIIDSRVHEAWEDSTIEQRPDLVSFSSAKLKNLSAALRRRLLVRAVNQLRPDGDLGFENLSKAADFAIQPGSSQIDLGAGLRLTREPPTVYLNVQSAALPQGDWPQLPLPSVEISVDAPGTLHLDHGWTFASRVDKLSLSSGEGIPGGADRFHACLDADTLPHDLQLRWPRRGDRMKPLGMRGRSQKLSDIFVNEKIPARARERWPVLASNGTVIWVPGYRPADGYRLGEHTRRFAFFSLTRTATPGV